MNIIRLNLYNTSVHLQKQYFYDKDTVIIDINNLDILTNIYNHDISIRHDILNIFDNLSESEKNDIMILFNVYLHGGLIINDKIVPIDYEYIKQLYNTYDICCVKSCLFNNIFNGFIICKKYCELIKQVFDEYIALPNGSIKIIDLLLNKMKNNVGALILNEQIINNVSYIFHTSDNNKTIVAQHHYKTDNIENLVTDFGNVKKSDLKNLKIGLTLAVPNDLLSFYSNGIRQNALYLYELLKNVYDNVYLIIEKKHEKSFLDMFTNVTFYRYNYKLVEDIYCDDYDLLISLSFEIPKHVVKNYKKRGKKVVAYLCGNSYIIDSELILYNHNKFLSLNEKYIDSFQNDYAYDEIWSIPQMYNQNKYYWETLYRCKCIEVPFVWSSNSINFIKQIMNINNDEDIMYKQKQNKVAIMEPNISLMKWALPSMLVTELCYRKHRNVNHLYITNISKTDDKFKINIDEFTNICKKLDLFIDKKLTIESRYNVLEFMQKNADIVVSHQWENPLNYLYFDLAWMGWPILHNAHLCKDIGYFYNGFNYEEGSDILNDIINNHANECDYYISRNRESISRYLPNNRALIDSYRDLIHDLFA